MNKESAELINDWISIDVFNTVFSDLLNNYEYMSDLIQKWPLRDDLHYNKMQEFLEISTLMNEEENRLSKIYPEYYDRWFVDYTDEHYIDGIVGSLILLFEEKDNNYFTVDFVFKKLYMDHVTKAAASVIEKSFPGFYDDYINYRLFKDIIE